MIKSNKVVEAYINKDSFKLPSFIQNLIHKEKKPVKQVDQDNLFKNFTDSLNPKQKEMFGQILTLITIYEN